MGQINLGSGSYKDYAEWRQTPAGKQSLASHRAKYGDQSMSPVPRLWQPDQNWQQQLAEYRGQQAGPPVIGNAPNGRPVTGAVTTAPQPAKAPDMSAYSPGRAQPQQPSQGTPYGQPAAPPPSQPSPAMPQPAPQPSFDWRSYFNQTPMVRESYEERFTPAPPPPAPEPPKFTSEFTQSMTGFGGQQSDPSQFYAQRDAFIQRLNDERGRQAAQAGVYGPGETPRFYQPSRDFGALWGQAGDMVSNGWTNPLAGLFG